MSAEVTMKSARSKASDPEAPGRERSRKPSIPELQERTSDIVCKGLRLKLKKQFIKQFEKYSQNVKSNANFD